MVAAEVAKIVEAADIEPVAAEVFARVVGIAADPSAAVAAEVVVAAEVGLDPDTLYLYLSTNGYRDK